MMMTLLKRRKVKDMMMAIVKQNLMEMPMHMLSTANIIIEARKELLVSWEFSEQLQAQQQVWWLLRWQLNPHHLS